MINVFAILPSAVPGWQSRKIEASIHIPKADSNLEEDESRRFIQKHLGMMYNQRRPMLIENGLAQIHVNDFLGGDLTFLDKCLGGSDYADISADLRAAAADSTVKSIQLNINSPGGEAVGCVEVGRLVAEIAKNKPVRAVVDRLCCSAAYAIAVGANEIIASPSAMVGSVGTILTWLDYAGLCQAAGISPHIVTNTGADLKAAGNQWRTPTEAETKNMQEFADRYGNDFRGWVSQRRNMPDQAFRGQAVRGEDARALNFVDSIQPPTSTKTMTTPSKSSSPLPTSIMPVSPGVKATGAAALKAATHPNAAVREPIVNSLQKSIEARPDFSFLTGLQRAQIAAEYDALGGLTAQNHALYMLRRKQYCEKHRLTPEMVSGQSQVIIPELIPDADVRQRREEQTAKAALPGLLAVLHRENIKVLEQAKTGKISEATVKYRAQILARVNACETILKKPLTP